MTYKNAFVAVIKCNGKILRERDDTIILPFGSEYSILLKNLETKRAVVDITIDGENALKGKQLVVDANSEIEIERFLDDLKKGNRFRFIQKTQEIADFRGDKVDDGIIRIEFRFEKDPIWKDDLIPKGGSIRWYYGPSCGGQSMTNYYYQTEKMPRSMSDITYASTFASTAPVCDSAPAPMASAPLAEEGVTVPGSISLQEFHTTSIGELEDVSRTIVFKLRGIESNGKTPVTKPLTVKTKIQCPTCGRKWKSNMKYCGNCSTALI